MNPFNNNFGTQKSKEHLEGRFQKDHIFKGTHSKKGPYSKEGSK